MSRRSRSPEVIVHCTVTFPDMAPVYEWLNTHAVPFDRSRARAAEAFLSALIVSNADWDNVPLTCRCDTVHSTQGVSL